VRNRMRSWLKLGFEETRVGSGRMPWLAIRYHDALWGQPWIVNGVVEIEGIFERLLSHVFFFHPLLIFFSGGKL